MQFLVYLSILMVSVSTVLLEIHWLTTPPLQPKSAVQASATPPRPKVEGPNAELSPVYPRKVEPVQPPPTQNNVQYNVGPAATATRRRGPKRFKSPSPKPQASQHALKALHRQTMRRMRRHMRHRQKRMRLTRRPHRTIAAMSRPARAPINRFALRTALTSRLTVRGACVARHRSSVPTANKETTRNVDPGAGARIRARWIEEHGGGSMMRMKTTRTMRSFPAEAAAGRP